MTPPETKSFNIIVGVTDCSSMTRFFCCVVFILSILSRSCLAWKAQTFTADLHLKDKIIDGENEGTFSDMTPLTCGSRCLSMSTCNFFFHHAGLQRCVLCSAKRGGTVTLNDAPGYQLYTMGDVPFDSSATPSNASECPNGTTIPQGCWVFVPPERKTVRISVGPAGVWVSNKNYRTMYRNGTYNKIEAVGDSWTNSRWDGVWVDVGRDVAAALNLQNALHLRNDISPTFDPKHDGWTDMQTNCSQATVSPSGSVWCLNESGTLFAFLDRYPALNVGSNRILKATNILAVDAGTAGVWALDLAGRLLCAEGTYGDLASPSADLVRWLAVGGDQVAAFRAVSSGSSVVVVVDEAGRVWLRIGVGPATPTGVAWVPYPSVPMNVVEVHETGGTIALWGASLEKNVYFSVLYHDP